MGVFSTTRPSRENGRSLEQRALTFIQPLIGAHLQALTDHTAGDIDSSMQHDTVWSCVNLLAYSMAMMPPYAYRGGPGQGIGPANQVTDQPVLLNQPSAYEDIFDFLFIGMMSLLLRGNIYGIIVDRDHAGRPTQIEIQHPDQVRVKQEDDGRVEYRVRNTPIPRQDMWHKAIHKMPGKVVGLSPIQYAAHLVRLGTNAREFGSRYFEDGGHPSALITNESTNLKEISPEDARTIKDRFMAAIRNSREPVVMGGGWKYEQIQIHPDESQFLDTQKLSDSKICGFFGVRPEMIGKASEGTAITYQNVENRMLDFMVYPLGPYMIRWERWLGAELPGRQYVKFDTRVLLKTDLLSRLRAYHLMADTHAFAPDEIRASEDLPPLTEAQKAQILQMAAGPVKPEGQNEV